MKKNILELVVAFALPVVASVGIILATCSCSVVNETNDPTASTRVELGTRAVVGLVFFDAIGVGFFLPSRTVSVLSEDSK